MDMKSVLIKDTTREERKRIIQEDYIEGKREIKEINMEFVSRYFVRG